jgi:hypothetical protein
MSQEAQTSTPQTQTPTQIPPDIQSLKIDTVIKVRHLFDEDVYDRTQVIAEIYGEAIINGRKITFPYRRVWRSQDLTIDMGSFIQSVLDDIKLQQQLMIDDIINYAKNRKALLEELSKVGQVIEEYVQDSDDSEDEDSDP